MVLSGLTLLACTHNLHITKRNSFSMAKLVRLNHLKTLLLNYWTAKTCSYYTCRTKAPPLLILDEAVKD
jgi:hypothetical protein